jgi:hypothetical protein
MISYNIHADFAARITAQRDEIILSILPEADRRMIEGLPVDQLHSLARRGTFAIFPDGREVFTWDGRVLLTFFPTQRSAWPLPAAVKQSTAWASLASLSPYHNNGA